MRGGKGMKTIIAPHVIDENHLVEIIGKLKRPYVRYTRADEKKRSRNRIRRQTV